MNHIKQVIKVEISAQYNKQ